MTLKTFTILIGNSDDKLSQKEWSDFVKWIDAVIDGYAHQIHFSGGASCDSKFQNYCWVIEVVDDGLMIPALKSDLVRFRQKYQQDSIAFIEGNTEFI